MRSNQCCFQAKAPRYRKLSSHTSLVLGHNDHKSCPRRRHPCFAHVDSHRLETPVRPRMRTLWNIWSGGHVSLMDGPVNNWLSLLQRLCRRRYACRRYLRSSTRWSLLLVLTDLSSMGDAKKILGTMVMQHVRSQIEPATAMLCVCASTYRPRFANWKNRTVKISQPSRVGQRHQVSEVGKHVTRPRPSYVNCNVNDDSMFVWVQRQDCWV